MPAPATIDVLGDASDAAQAASDVLEGMVRVAARQISRSPDAYPHIRNARVRYRREEPGSEHWLFPSQLLAAGIGDCEDLSLYHAGWLRAHRVDIGARAIVVRNGSGYHAVVLRSNGAIEDPSLWLLSPPMRKNMEDEDENEGMEEGYEEEQDVAPPPPPPPPPPAAVRAEGRPQLSSLPDGRVALTLPALHLPNQKIGGARLVGSAEDVAAAARRVINNPVASAVLPGAYRNAALAAIKVGAVGAKYGPKAVRMVMKHGPRALKAIKRLFR